MGCIEDATPERKQRGEIIRDIIAKMDQGGFPRMRAKSLITPYQARMRLLDEIKELPDEAWIKSVRRRLTRLDRALSDQEAYALDRAFNAWLILQGSPKSIDWSGAGGGSNDFAMPLNNGQLNEGRAYNAMYRKLKSFMRLDMEELFRAMAPDSESKCHCTNGEIQKLAKSIKNAYEQK